MTGWFQARQGKKLDDLVRLAWIYAALVGWRIASVAARLASLAAPLPTASVVSRLQ
ncbi:hypothetical protein Micbo1qcDRAFT_210181 [Microdochium bolleyi]|uniref:Uncharacterized protein n=1 Tax=Microdochium bolleyi TaxID=196109 RepID=A0A136IJN8_9PEZI|nr:hypothetical protein Micbo1qcDRAFT_210181 [Microdochium bolleyi]